MLRIQYFVSSQFPEATPSLPLGSCPINGAWQRQRRRLRLYLVGSEPDTQATIDTLHAQGCIDRLEWTPTAIAIPENGILIRRDPGDVLRYLQRDRLFS